MTLQEMREWLGDLPDLLNKLPEGARSEFQSHLGSLQKAKLLTQSAYGESKEDKNA